MEKYNDRTHEFEEVTDETELNQIQMSIFDLMQEVESNRKMEVEEK